MHSCKASAAKFNEAMAADDTAKETETYYRNNGYRNVHVSRELKFSDDFCFVEVIFHVQGRRPLPRAGLVARRQLQATARASELETIVQTKKGDWYNQMTVSKDVRNLTAYVGWRGYKADVKETVEAVADTPGVVRVHFQVDDHPIAYVGEVYVVGNTITQDRVIRRQLQQIPPGQVLRYPELKIAEANLARLNIFEMNPELGVRPTITPLESDGPFKDILVKVQETCTGSSMLGAGADPDNGFVGSIVLNERNFDIFRVPTSWSDFFEGKAFRGGGQEFRIEAVPGTQYIQRAIPSPA